MSPCHPILTLFANKGNTGAAEGNPGVGEGLAGNSKPEKAEKFQPDSKVHLKGAPLETGCWLPLQIEDIRYPAAEAWVV